MTILLVEDSDDDAELLSRHLRAASRANICRVRRLSEADSAIRLVQPQLIVADLALPDASGIAVVRQLKLLEPEIPLVVVTGGEDRETAIATLHAGAQDCISKSDLSGALLERALAFAIERNAYEARMHRDLLELIAAHEDIANSQQSLEELLSSICERTLRIVGAGAAVVEMPEGSEMVYRGVAGLAKNLLGLRLKIEGSLSGTAYRTKTILVCDDSDTDPRVDREACRKVSARSMAVVPLTAHGQVCGVLKAISSQPAAFSLLDVDRLRALSHVTGSLLAQSALLSEKQAALQKLENALQALQALSAPGRSVI